MAATLPSARSRVGWRQASAKQSAKRNGSLRRSRSVKAFDLEQAVNRFGLLTRVTETLALLCSVGLTFPPRRAAKETLSVLALTVLSQLNHIAPKEHAVGAPLANALQLLPQPLYVNQTLSRVLLLSLIHISEPTRPY